MIFPCKSETYSVPARQLTDEEMEIWAWRCFRNAREVYSEDQGVWKTFPEYLAFRIGVESLSYVHWDSGREDMERFARMVMKHAE